MTQPTISPAAMPDRARTTLSAAIETLVAEGFTEHFVVRGGQLHGLNRGARLEADDVIIRGFSRFEGISDPGDMSIVYAIEARDGSRGTLTDAFGVYSDPMISAFVHKVRGLTGDTAVWMPRP